MELYIDAIKCAISKPETTWKDDPFEHPYKVLREKLGETSGEIENVSDLRLNFASLLGKVYLKLSKHLEVQKSKVEDEYQILSLNNITLICESFQFFVLTSILPFVEQGVGIGAQYRSKFVKSWKLFNGNIEEQRKYLENAANVIVNLFRANEPLRIQLSKKFIDDIMALRFQLQNIGILKFDKNLAEIIDETSKDLQISALLALCKNKRGAPVWLQKTCGHELSKVLIKPDGLLNFLVYYDDVGGEHWTDNIPLRRFVAQVLAMVPKIEKLSSLAYHSNIFKQFQQLLESSSTNKQSNRKIYQLFVEFVSSVQQKYEHNANLVIFDYFLRFFEILVEKMRTQTNVDEKVEGFQDPQKNLKILENMIILGGFVVNERILKLFPVFISLSQFEIVKAILEKVENPGDLLYKYLMTPMRSLRPVEPEKPMIVEISDEISPISNIDLWIDGIDEPEIGLAKRLEFVCDNMNKFIEPKKSTTVLLEILSNGVEEWMRNVNSNDEEENRFTGGNNEQYENALYAHLVVGYCFERIATYLSEDGFEIDDQRSILMLLKIVENVISKSNEIMASILKKSREMDIFKITDEENASFETMTETAKMAVGLAGGIVVAASFQPDILEHLEKTLRSLKRFVELAGSVPNCDDKLRNVADEGKSLLDLMDVRVDQQVFEPSTSSGKTAEKQGDLCEELLKDLRNSTEEMAIRGGALIQISRIFRKRNVKFVTRLEELNVFEEVKEQIMNTDSYIFLSAINCLGEMAVYDRKYLEKLIDLYSDMKNTTEEHVIRKGRIGEALGKVFRELGQVSIFYLDRICNVFVISIKENDEIIRASSCSALADVVIATRGRGIEKWLDEVLFLIDSIVLVDKSSLVRRSAVDLIRQFVKSCSIDVLQIMGNRLRDIRRKMVSLWKYDRDEVVRLHAQLCIDELKAELQSIFEEENSRYCRPIKF